MHVDEVQMDIEGVSPSLSGQIACTKEKSESQSHEINHQTSSTNHSTKPELATSDTVTGITTDHEDTDLLAIIDDLARSNLARQRTSDTTHPLSSASEPYHRTEGSHHHEVPKRLVPSASTERIMDILRERGLDVGTQKSEGEKKRLLDESLEEVAEEESYSSGQEEGEMATPYHGRDHFSSSTPAEKLGEQVHHNRGSRAEGVMSPPHLFSVGSSPVHGSNQELHRRSSLNSLVSLPEGTYLGEAKHKDGSLMSIVFQVCELTLECR